MKTRGAVVRLPNSPWDCLDRYVNGMRLTKNLGMVNGYTDSTPIGAGLKAQGITTNLILSQKRADDVMQYMISQGVKPDLVSAHGPGDSNPAASNDTPEGRAQNRRVELTLSGAGN